MNTRSKTHSPAKLKSEAGDKTAGASQDCAEYTREECETLANMVKGQDSKQAVQDLDREKLTVAEHEMGKGRPELPPYEPFWDDPNYGQTPKAQGEPELPENMIDRLNAKPDWANEPQAQHSPLPRPAIKMDKSWTALIDEKLGPHGSNAFGGGKEIVRRYNNAEALERACNANAAAYQAKYDECERTRNSAEALAEALKRIIRDDDLAAMRHAETMLANFERN